MSQLQALVKAAQRLLSLHSRLARQQLVELADLEAAVNMSNNQEARMSDTTIILNAEAVNALFPEGSEARVLLQGTVLKKLAEQFIKNPDAIARVTAQVVDATRRAQLEALAELGIQSDGVNRFELNSNAKKAIRAETESLIYTAAREAVAELSIQGEVRDAVSMQTTLEVKKQVRDRLAEIQAKLGAGS